MSFYQTILDAIYQLWKWFAHEFVPWLVELFRAQTEWALRNGLVPLVPILKLCTFLLVCFELALLSIDIILESLLAINFDQVLSPDTGLIAFGVFCNRFLPLIEGVACAILLTQIYIAIVVLRWIKSFIPTISN